MDAELKGFKNAHNNFFRFRKETNIAICVQQKIFLQSITTCQIFYFNRIIKLIKIC